MTTVGLLHPGAMGSSIGAALRAGGNDVLWASADRSLATRARAEADDLTDCGTLADLVRRWPDQARYRYALAEVALRLGDAALYLQQARFVVVEIERRDWSDHSTGVLLEILRLGGLNRLYQSGVAAFGRRRVRRERLERSRTRQFCNELGKVSSRSQREPHAGGRDRREVLRRHADRQWGEASSREIVRLAMTHPRPHHQRRPS